MEELAPVTFAQIESCTLDYAEPILPPFPFPEQKRTASTSVLTKSGRQSFSERVRRQPPLSTTALRWSLGRNTVEVMCVISNQKFEHCGHVIQTSLDICDRRGPEVDCEGIMEKRVPETCGPCKDMAWKGDRRWDVKMVVKGAGVESGVESMPSLTALLGGGEGPLGVVGEVEGSQRKSTPGNPDIGRLNDAETGKNRRSPVPTQKQDTKQSENTTTQEKQPRPYKGFFGNKLMATLAYGKRVSVEESSKEYKGLFRDTWERAKKGLGAQAAEEQALRMWSNNDRFRWDPLPKPYMGLFAFHRKFRAKEAVVLRFSQPVMMAMMDRGGACSIHMIR